VRNTTLLRMIAVWKNRPRGTIMNAAGRGVVVQRSGLPPRARKDRYGLPDYAL